MMTRAAAWLADLETAVVVLAIASGIVGLGLFMTWGDQGSRLGNAVKALFVLFALVGGVVALLAWAASTAGPGS